MDGCYLLDRKSNGPIKQKKQTTGEKDVQGVELGTFQNDSTLDRPTSKSRTHFIQILYTFLYLQEKVEAVYPLRFAIYDN